MNHINGYATVPKDIRFISTIFLHSETRDLILHKSTPCLDCESDSSLAKPQQNNTFDAQMTLKRIFK